MADITQNQGADDDEVDLRALFGTIFAHKFSILVITLVFISFGVAYALFSPPVYQATALLQLEEKSGGGLAMSPEISALFGEPPQTASEIEILKSRMILGQAIENRALTTISTPRRLPVIGDFLRRYDLPKPTWAFLRPFAWNEEQIDVARLIVPKSLEGKALRLTAEGDGRYTLETGVGAPLAGQVGVALQDKASGITLLVDQLIGAPGRQFDVMSMSMGKRLEDIRAQFSIGERSKGSSILQLSLKDLNEAEAVKTLNNILQVYLLQNLSRNAAEAEASLSFIQNQIPEAEAQVSAAERALNAYKESQSSIDLSFETRALLEEAVQIEAQLNVLALEEYELQKRYTEQHPVYQTLLQKRAQMEDRLQAIKSQTSDLPTTQQDILRLSQDLEVSQQIYFQLLNRAQELSVVKAGTIGNVRIIDSAFPASEPVAPNKKIIVILAGVIGLVAGIGLALLRAMLSRGVRSTDDIEALGISVYATIPKIGNGQFGGGASKKGRRPILANEDPTNLGVEALRSLRTSLHFGMLDAKSSLLMVTSAKPGEGKSFLSVNLATVIAQSGQSVCLLDADIRRGFARRFFGVAKSAKGLTDVLTGAATIEEVLVKDETSGLYFIPTGKYPPNPSELLMHQNFGEVMAYLDKRFDLTIIDTPPVLAVTDPVIIGKYAGMILLAVRFDLTAANEVAAAKKALEVANLKITGSVLNGFDAKKTDVGYATSSYRYEYKTRT